MLIFLTVIQVLVALVLVALVLIQKGQGSDMGSAFGSGASQTVFGSQGSGNFLTRATALAAAVFFLSSLGLSYLSSHVGRDSVMSKLPAGRNAVPANPAATAAQPPSGPVPAAQPRTSNPPAAQHP